MSEETKKVDMKAEQTEQEAKPTELSDKDLGQVAGGHVECEDGLNRTRPGNHKKTVLSQNS